MSTPQDPGQQPTQQYGGQPGYPQQGGYGAPPPRDSNPWPWVIAGVAIIVAGVIAALLITGGGEGDSPKTTSTTTITTTAPALPTTTLTTTQTQTQAQPTTNTTTVTPTITRTTTSSGGTEAP